MLNRLRVKNYALIEDLDITFDEGLNILTGSTGAGKSIIIGSMNLILGEKASMEMVRSGKKEAFIEAGFDIIKTPPPIIRQFLYEGDNTLLLKRQVKREGRSYAFINDQQVTLSTLKEIGNYLADLLGQHHHQSLLDSTIHRELLDRFCLDNKLREKYRKTFKQLKTTEQDLKTILDEDRLSRERRELYRFQLNEIDKAELQPDEKETLKKERTVLQNVQKILSSAQRINHELSEDDNSILNHLKFLLKEFEALSRLDSSLQNKTDQWRETVFSLEDLAYELNHYADSIQSDPARLEWVEERLQLYSDFAKKYGENYDAVINYRNKVEQDLNSIENRDARIKEFTTQINQLKTEVINLGKNITKKRSAGAKTLKDQIEKELHELGMKGTQFGVQFTPISNLNSALDLSKNNSLCYAGDNGLEDVEFMISPNVGEPLKPLAKIASGGEISRIMLALKTVLAEVDKIPLLIFDEIDMGIGGDIASYVGKKIKKLSKNHQIICITHLQQIAAFADTHFRVSKEQKAERVVTEVIKLSHDDRVSEIARMIAGKEITTLTLEHAREFLNEVST